MAAFDDLAAHLDYPMFVVTVAARGERSGCLVGFTTQVSIDPARFLVGLSEQNHTFRIAGAASHLAVHLLRSGQRDLAELFGGETGDDVDKFADCRWHEGAAGTPVLDDSPGWFVGRILERVPLGDHTAFVLEPEEAYVDGEVGDLLTFTDVRDLDPGHEA